LPNGAARKKKPSSALREGRPSAAAARPKVKVNLNSPETFLLSHIKRFLFLEKHFPELCGKNWGAGDGILYRIHKKT